MDPLPHRQRPRHAVLFELLRQESLSACIADRQRWRARFDHQARVLTRLQARAERSWRRPPGTVPGQTAGTAR